MRQVRMAAIAAAAGVAVFGLAGAARAQGQVVTADPQVLLKVVQAAGWPATLGTDSTGDPMITSSVTSIKFVVLFYNCVNHKDCTTIQLQTAWAMKVKPTLGSMNEWNRKHRFGRAYVDDVGDPGIMMDINLDKGGEPMALFRDQLGVWASLLDKFKPYIGAT